MALHSRLARSRRSVRTPFCAALLISTLGLSRSARADDLCPIGATEKKEDGFAWCEPSVCTTDIQCGQGSICRPIPLCVEIGAVDAGKGDAAASQRLLARQRCGENKSCPQSTTCSDKSRCITLAQADKAGLTTMTANSAGSAASSAGSPEGAKKSACGCSVPGTRGGELAGGALGLLGVALIVGRRRARRA